MLHRTLADANQTTGTAERIEAPPGARDRYAALNDLVDASRAEVVEVAGLTVSRSDFVSVGGFHEGVVAGGEYDLAARLRAIGRDVALPRPPGGGARRWLARRHPGVGRPRTPLALLRYLAADNRIAARRRRPARAADPSAAVVVVTDAYPARSETFIDNEVAALREQGWSVRVESSARPARIERAAARARAGRLPRGRPAARRPRRPLPPRHPPSAPLPRRSPGAAAVA